MFLYMRFEIKWLTTLKPQIKSDGQFNSVPLLKQKKFINIKNTKY